MRRNHEKVSQMDEFGTATTDSTGDISASSDQQPEVMMESGSRSLLKWIRNNILYSARVYNRIHSGTAFVMISVTSHAVR